MSKLRENIFSRSVTYLRPSSYHSEPLFMKRLFIFSLLLLAGPVILQAQQIINDPNAEKRNLEGFHGIEVSSGIRLILTEGKTEEVAVSAATIDFRDHIITRVENGILKLYYKNDLVKSLKREKRELKAYVSYKNFDYLYANTGADVDITGTLKSVSFKIKSNTGAVIKGGVNIDDLEVDQDTGSVITLTGDTGKLDVEGDTGSMFKGIDLKTNTCKAMASTGAGVYITVQKELNVKANTGGYIKYKGDAGIREVKTNTGGSITKI